ncbi:MAG: SUMF1/EgtB/PvdO family nonheme iron enzyme [bacterium]|nr:SUMF1/EgtB/PvdO family nonheme iron enzyme [bacterium]
MLEFLTTTLGAAIKSLAVKAVTGPAEKVARKALAGVDGKPVSEATAAVQRAVEAARKELVNDFWAGEDDLSRDVVTLMRHPPFAEAVVRRLLFRGQPDFDRLRRAYLDLDGGEDRAAKSERWQELEGPLAVFFEVVERHLEVDPIVGPLLRDGRMLAALGRLEADQRVVAEASREIQRYQRRAALAAESGSGKLGDLAALAAGQRATLGKILELMVEDRDRAVAAPGAAVGLTAGLLGAEERYLRLLRRECNRLPLADDPRDVSAERVERPELANVYIDLETRAAPGASRVFDRLGVPEGERQKILQLMGIESFADSPEVVLEDAALSKRFLKPPTEELRDDHPLRQWVPDKQALTAANLPLTTLEALAQEPFLVLLGDPGSGKSTFVNHLAVTLASRLLGDEADPLEMSSGPLEEPWFPVRIVLRQWSAGLRPEAVEAGAELELLYQALAELPGDVPRERWLERFDDESTLVLFDGLDEVPAGGGGNSDLDRRRLIVGAVEAFRAAHPRCRVLVTCRVRPYREGPHQLEGAPVFELAPLDDDRIRRFCARWYDELARVGRLAEDEAGERRERLLVALGERQVLRQMAGTPLLLTMLARVNARARLPESRVELYGECVEQLLWEWERQKRGVASSLADLLEAPGLKRAEFERVLWRLTWEAHGASGKEGTVDLPFDALREALARIHPDRDEGWSWANRVLELMRERGGLLVESEPGVFTFPHRSFQEYLACRWLLAQGDAPLTASRLAGDDTWGEVILLACGFLGSQGHSGDLQAIVAALVAGGEPEAPEDWRRVLLAGRAWLEFGPHRAEERQGDELKAEVPRLLTALMQRPDLPPKQRLEAGLVAADLGELPPDLDTWVEIPADTLEYAFRIGKYPVTSAQYRRFVEAGGYDREQGWFSEAAQKEILEFQRMVGSEEWPVGPRFESDPRLNRASQPVTGVSWYEAAAYAAWQTAELRATGEIGDDEAVRLGSEAEWARAAGGTEGRRYSWGDEFDFNWANTEESQLGRPTPVHMYPSGATAEGVFDLTGNVWEWNADRTKTRFYVVAGGAYYRGADGVGASARARYGRYRRSGSVGFRLVVVPISRADPDS